MADLKAFIDHLGLERVGIVTHDVGPWIVQPFARQNPDRVAGIFFFDCPYGRFDVDLARRSTSRERPQECHFGYTRRDGTNEHPGPSFPCSFRVVPS